MNKILIVDDEGELRRVTVDFLKDYNPDLIIEEAANGVAGLEKIKSTVFSVIITDVEMPKMNGITMIHEARKLATTRATKFIILTGDPRKEYAEVAPCLVKPFPCADLIEIFKKLS